MQSSYMRKSLWQKTIYLHYQIECGDMLASALNDCLCTQTVAEIFLLPDLVSPKFLEFPTFLLVLIISSSNFTLMGEQLILLKFGT